MTMDPNPFSIAVTSVGGRAVVTVRGELDLATAPELERALHAHLDGGGDVLLDLRELDFMDSSGVRVLVRAHASAAQLGGHFVVVRPPSDSPVAAILSIAGIDSRITLLDQPS